MPTPDDQCVHNPRRSPRARACRVVSVASGAGTFEATTEDVGAYGCRLVAARLVRKGEPIHLVLTYPGLTISLKVRGRVAWAADAAPWRLGVAFDEACHDQSARWFSLLLSMPGLSTCQRVPDRIAISATVYLGPPPRFVLDVTSEELLLLQEIRSGISIAELLARLPAQRAVMERSLFSLLAHRHATLSRGASVHPNAWKAIFMAQQAVSAAADFSAPAADRAALRPGLPAAAGVAHSAAVAGSKPRDLRYETGRPATVALPMIPPSGWSRR